jgi:hypothetical protein
MAIGIILAGVTGWVGRALVPAIARAATVQVAGAPLRVMSAADLVRDKLRAAADPTRRRSKRLQDLADAQALLESTPALEQELTPEERALLGQLPR